MELFKWDLFLSVFPELLLYMPLTLLIVVVSTLFGFVLGSVLALVRLYRVPVLAQVSNVLISFVRGIPILVLLFLVYIGLPVFFSFFGLNINRWDTLFFVLIAYSVNSAAFFSEIIRSSINGVDRKQTEAALSVGLTPLQTFSRIVLPQAVRIALPSFSVSIVNLLKDTSLAYSVGVIDMVGIISSIRIRTSRSLEAYAAAAIIFFTVSFILETGFARLNHKLGGSGKGI